MTRIIANHVPLSVTWNQIELASTMFVAYIFNRNTFFYFVIHADMKGTVE